MRQFLNVNKKHVWTKLVYTYIASALSLSLYIYIYKYKYKYIDDCKKKIWRQRPFQVEVGRSVYQKYLREPQLEVKCDTAILPNRKETSKHLLNHKTIISVRPSRFVLLLALSLSLSFSISLFFCISFNTVLKKTLAWKEQNQFNGT